MMVIVWSWYIKNFFVCCQSEILAKEISKLAHVKLALGSASTALAATLYKNFETTHSLLSGGTRQGPYNLPTECLRSHGISHVEHVYRPPMAFASHKHNY